MQITVCNCGVGVQLCDVGIDFGYTLHKMLLESIAECVNESRDQLVEANRHRATVILVITYLNLFWFLID